MIERELSEKIVKQTNLRELAIQEKNFEIQRQKNKFDSTERTYEHSNSETEGRGKNARTINFYQY